VITLALHGEVLVGGWSAAQSHDEKPLSVRYTAETATAALHAIDDLHEDVRAVGACLFEALVHRPPTAGARDPFADVATTEGVRLSPRVCALIRRALRTTKAGGYRSMAELHQAIEACLTEELVETHPSSPARYRHRNRWLRRGAVAACLAMAGTALWMLPHWLNPGDSWSSEIAGESFSDDSWRSRWSGGDAWTVQDGRLVSQGADSSRLTLRQRVSVPVAIEYTARFDPGQRPGDLSVVWSEGGSGGAAAGARTFSIQAGAYDNSYCGIFLQPGDRRLLERAVGTAIGFNRSRTPQRHEPLDPAGSPFGARQPRCCRGRPGRRGGFR
jgi:hypothetical protein